MPRKVGNVMYRVYGTIDGDGYDEYYSATVAQMAVDLAREAHGNGYEVIEVAKVVSNWR